PAKLVDKEIGKPERAIEIAPVSSVGQLARGPNGQLLFESESFTEPSTWYRYDPATVQTSKTGLAEKSPASFGDVEVTRQTAVSRDGTRVPMTILRRKGTKLDGNNPTLLTGYGGCAISTTPSFAARRRLWFDHGGVWVVANLRGGSEMGDTWH